MGTRMRGTRPAFMKRRHKRLPLGEPFEGGVGKPVSYDKDL
jgi:hypothetical protein